MEAIIKRQRYSTETATLLADDEYADRSDRLPHGRATHLYRAPNGGYFAHHETIWQREHDTIEPLTASEAADLYESLINHEIPFEEAFPDIPVVDA